MQKTHYGHPGRINYFLGWAASGLTEVRKGFKNTGAREQSSLISHLVARWGRMGFFTAMGFLHRCKKPIMAIWAELIIFLAEPLGRPPRRNGFFHRSGFFTGEKTQAHMNLIVIRRICLPLGLNDLIIFPLWRSTVMPFWNPIKSTTIWTHLSACPIFNKSASGIVHHIPSPDVVEQML